MEQPPWGFQLQSKREQQDSGRQGTWEKIKYPAMLRDVEHANFFPFPTLSNTGIWKENKSLKGFQSICSLMDRQLWKWHALRLHDHKLQSYICSWAKIQTCTPIIFTALANQLEGSNYYLSAAAMLTYCTHQGNSNLRRNKTKTILIA